MAESTQASNERRAQWAKANRPRRNASHRAWYNRNPERARQVAREWYHRNKETAGARRQEWRENNPGLVAAQNNRRRERVKSVEQCDAVSSVVLAQLITACARMKCAICGKNMPKSDRTIDHVIPLAKGGTGHIANLQIVHLRCNCAKNQKAPDQTTGQYEINFAGNRAYLNASQGTERNPNTQDNSAGLGNGQRLTTEKTMIS